MAGSEWSTFTISYKELLKISLFSNKIINILSKASNHY